MAKIYDVVSHGGEYEKDGQTKTRWINHGAVFEKDGKLSMKLDSYPASGDGWFKLFEKRSKQSSPPPQDDFNDDIPWPT